MAAFTNSINFVASSTAVNWKATLLSELSGLAIGFVTLAWILASLHAL